MAQATVLATGTTEATSTDITVAAGEAVTVGVFAAAAGERVPTSVGFRVLQATPGGDGLIDVLTQKNRVTVLAGPGTYRVHRPAYTGPEFGVYTES
ncbi:MAG: hypothetical protein ACQEXC_14085 [Pseudomonadota bacterium]